MSAPSSSRVKTPQIQREHAEHKRYLDSDRSRYQSGVNKALSSLALYSGPCQRAASGRITSHVLTDIRYTRFG